MSLYLSIHTSIQVLILPELFDMVVLCPQTFLYWQDIPEFQCSCRKNEQVNRNSPTPA